MTAEPQDRQPKKGFARLDGTDYPLRAHLDDDWTFVEMSAAASQGKIAAAVRVAQYVLDDNEDAYEALKRECTADDGHVSATAINRKIQAILEASSPNS